MIASRAENDMIEGTFLILRTGAWGKKKQSSTNRRIYAKSQKSCKRAGAFIER
jgi:hypothetical protein